MPRPPKNSAAPTSAGTSWLLPKIALAIFFLVGAAGLLLRLTHPAGTIELAGYVLLMLFGLIGLLWLIVKRPERTRSTVAESTPLPPVHTLVTLSHGDSAESGLAFTGEQSDSVLTLHTEIDAILFERLDEYKTYRPNEGCILLVTETMPPGVSAQAGAPQMSGSNAVLSLARTLAEIRRTPTLLIDTGSPAWSGYRPSDDGYAPDVIPLPRVPGVYEMIAGEYAIDDWLLLEDEVTSLSALAPGDIPADWPEHLRSHGMRRLLAAARMVADVVIVYAPRCIEWPDVVAELSAWSNGLLIVSGANASTAAYEAQSVSRLADAGAVILGRIALNTASAEASAPLLDPASAAQAVSASPAA